MRPFNHVQSGEVPADVAGRVMIDALGDCRLRFLSIGRLTLIWDSRQPRSVPETSDEREQM